MKCIRIKNYIVKCDCWLVTLPNELTDYIGVYCKRKAVHILAQYRKEPFNARVVFLPFSSLLLGRKQVSDTQFDDHNGVSATVSE